MIDAMERFKIEHFNRDHPGKTFPTFHVVGGVAARNLCVELIERMYPKKNISVADILSQIEHAETVIQGVDANDSDFDLRLVLERLKISPTKYVFLNWHRFESFDRFEFSDVNKCLHDIWYPSSDDLDIFDESLGWIVSIRHDGAVTILRGDFRETTPRQVD